MSVKLVLDDAGEPDSGLSINLGGDRSLIREDHALQAFML